MTVIAQPRGPSSTARRRPVARRRSCWPRPGSCAGGRGASGSQRAPRSSPAHVRPQACRAQAQRCAAWSLAPTRAAPCRSAGFAFSRAARLNAISAASRPTDRCPPRGGPPSASCQRRSRPAVSRQHDLADGSPTFSRTWSRSSGARCCAAAIRAAAPAHRAQSPASPRGG